MQFSFKTKMIKTSNKNIPVIKPCNYIKLNHSIADVQTGRAKII